MKRKKRWLCSNCLAVVRSKRRPGQCTSCGSLTSPWARLEDEGPAPPSSTLYETL